jgi:WD40 repeat protein
MRQKMTDSLKFSCVNHEDIFTAIAFSPNGYYLATAGLDTTARVWEIRSGLEVSRVNHEDIVGEIAFSPDGRCFATASEDKTAQVWETETGRRIACLQHEDSVCNIAFCMGGQFLISTTGSKVFPRAALSPCTATIWEIATGRKAMYIIHPQGLNTVTFSPDGRYIALADSIGTTGVWEASIAQKAINLNHKYDTNSTAMLASNQKQLITVGYNQGTWLWETSSSAPVTCLYQAESIVAVTFCPTGRYIAVASLGGIAIVQDVVSGQETARIAHDQEINSLAFSPDGKHLVTASDDCTTRIWEITSAEEVACIVQENKVNAATFSPDGKLLATASGDLMLQEQSQVPCLWLWHFHELLASQSLKV